jgi:hypothetical protein
VTLKVSKQVLRADGQDIAVVDLTLVDIKGRTVPDACDKIMISLDGSAELLGWGNGDPGYKQAERPQGADRRHARLQRSWARRRSSSAVWRWHHAVTLSVATAGQKVPAVTSLPYNRWRQNGMCIDGRLGLSHGRSLSGSRSRQIRAARALSCRHCMRWMSRRSW